MEMHQIRYFLAVSRMLNFTRAAEGCNVTQPALTRAVKLLEAELGGDLFRRERGLTHLTELGRRLLPVLQRCYDTALEVKLSAESYAKSSGVALQIALADGIGLDPLTSYLGQVADVFPTIDINLHRGSIEDALGWLKKGDVEFAVATGMDDKWARIERWQLACEHYTLVVNSAHPLSRLGEVAISALAGERLLATPGNNLVEAIVCELGSDVTAYREVATVPDIVSLVAAHFGVGVLPLSTVLPANLARIKVMSADLSRDISLYAVAGRKRSKAAQLLVKTLRRERGSAAVPAISERGGMLLDLAQ